MRLLDVFSGKKKRENQAMIEAFRMMTQEMHPRGQRQGSDVEMAVFSSTDSEAFR